MGMKLSKPLLKRGLLFRRSTHRHNPEGSLSAPCTTSSTCDWQQCPCKSQAHICENGRKYQAKADWINLDKHHGNQSCETVPLPVENAVSSSKIEWDGQDDVESEWRLSIGDVSKLDTDEKVTRLMTSLHDVLSTELDWGPRGRRRIQIRVSVTSESRPRKEMSPHPSSERDKHLPNDVRLPSVKERRNEAIISEDSHRKESLSRRMYYRDIPGRDHDNGSKTCTSTSHDTRLKKHGESLIRSSSRDKAIQYGSCCRKQESCCRHRSAVDQSFKEAMYLRLTELQRETSREANNITRLHPDTSDSEGTDSEYSGNDDNRVLGSEPEHQCARLFEPLLPGRMEIKRQANTMMKAERVKRTTLSKKRSFSSTPSSHGYLRATAFVQGGVGVPPSTSKIKISSQLLKKHMHEHIHHHHYYYCKTDS